MKKALSLALSLLLSISVLTACDSGDPKPEQLVEDSPTGTTTTTAETPSPATSDATVPTTDTTAADDETADTQTEAPTDDPSAPTKDTTVSGTATSSGDKTTAKPTTKAKQPTASKTQSTKDDHAKITTRATAKPTSKTTRSKTEPKKTTTTTDKDWPVIVVDMQDDYFYRSPDYTVLMSLDDPCVSPALTELMDACNGMDVLYSVIVEIPNFREDQKQYNEEMAQIEEEYIINAAAFDEEAKRLDPSYDYNKVNVWSDKLRELYDNIEIIKEKEDAVIERGRKTLETFRKQRLEKLKTLIGKEPIPISTDNRYYPHVANLYPDYVFFMELTADEINTLAKHGGYIIRLKRSSGDRG